MSTIWKLVRWDFAVWNLDVVGVTYCGPSLTISSQPKKESATATPSVANSCPCYEKIMTSPMHVLEDCIQSSGLYDDQSCSGSVVVNSKFIISMRFICDMLTWSRSTCSRDAWACDLEMSRLGGRSDLTRTCSIAPLAPSCSTSRDVYRCLCAVVPPPHDNTMLPMGWMFVRLWTSSIAGNVACLKYFCFGTAHARTDACLRFMWSWQLIYCIDANVDVVDVLVVPYASAYVDNGALMVLRCVSFGWLPSSLGHGDIMCAIALWQAHRVVVSNDVHPHPGPCMVEVKNVTCATPMSII